MASDIEREELTIHALAVLIGLPVVVVIIATHRPFDGAATLSLLCLGFGLVGLVRAAIARRRTRHRALPLLLLGAVLAPTASRAEPPAVVMRGSVEGYYQLHAQNPDNRVTALRGFDSRSRTFTLANAVLDARAVAGRVTTHLALQVGPTGAAYYAAEPALAATGGASASGPALWQHVQTATIGLEQGATLVEAGLFPSPIGPEVFAVKDNLNWSRSNLFVALPYYHTGVRASRPLGGAWTGTLALYNGWNSVVDSDPWPSVSAAASYAAAGTSAQVLYVGGSERPTGAPEGRAWRHLVDVIVQRAVTARVTLAAHADAGLERNDVGTSAWAAGALYARATLHPSVYAAARVDHVREQTDGAAPMLIPVRWVSAGTLTLAYQPTDPVSVRLEYRHDQAAGDVYFGGDVATDPVTQLAVPDRRSQDTVTLGATAWF